MWSRTICLPLRPCRVPRHRRFDYPEQAIWLDQYTVIEANWKISVYRNWFQDYTPETVTEELSQGGFIVDSLWGNLTGEPFTANSEWIGIVSHKK